MREEFPIEYYRQRRKRANFEPDSTFAVFSGRDRRMCDRKTCVGILVGDHSINCCNERFGPVNTTENNCVLDCAANHKSWPLIYPVGIEFSSRSLDFSVYCRILNSSLEGRPVQTART